MPTIDATTSTIDSSTTSSVSTATRILVGTLLVWGAVHVIGGGVLVAAGADSARDGLAAVGTALDPGPVTGDEGRVVQGVVAFHGLNILLGGIAVLVLGWRARRGGRRDTVEALLVVAALDLGLILFLVGPGVMRVADGLPGPVLLAAALAALPFARRSWRDRTTARLDG